MLPSLLVTRGWTDDTCFTLPTWGFDVRGTKSSVNKGAETRLFTGLLTAVRGRFGGTASKSMTSAALTDLRVVEYEATATFGTGCEMRNGGLLYAGIDMASGCGFEGGGGGEAATFRGAVGGGGGGPAFFTTV